MRKNIYYAAVLLLLGFGRAEAKSQVPVDVVQADGAVCFVLEQAYEVSDMRVIPAAPAKDAPRLLWEQRHSMTTPIKERRNPKLKVLRYGQKFDEFKVSTGPLELAKGVQYRVILELAGGYFAQEDFVINKNGRLFMPNPSFPRQKGRVYTAVKDKAGNLDLVLTAK